jgi:glutamyl-Q tRNA(Asp) synthetase
MEDRADRGGDPVLARKDGAPAYHLAVVLDDAAQGVTLVVRGEDLVTATPLQRLLQQLLGLMEPAYLHHPLLADANGRRLAKRDRAATLAAMRAAGGDGGAVRAALLRQSAPLLAAAGLPISDANAHGNRAAGGEP